MFGKTFEGEDVKIYIGSLGDKTAVNEGYKIFRNNQVFKMRLSNPRGRSGKIITPDLREYDLIFERMGVDGSAVYNTDAPDVTLVYITRGGNSGGIHIKGSEEKPLAPPEEDLPASSFVLQKETDSKILSKYKLGKNI